MKKDCFVFDCDEVLLDHLNGLRKFVKEHYDIDTTTYYPTEYDLCNWLNCAQPEVQEIIRHFNQNSYEFGLLKPTTARTVYAMRKIRADYPDAHIVVLTKSGTMGHGKVLRKVNLIHEFGNDVFDEINIIEMYESKKGELYKLKQKYNVRFLVDDHISNIETAQSLGIPGIMYAAMHNVSYSETKDFLYVNNWYILPTIIDDLLKGE